MIRFIKSLCTIFVLFSFLSGARAEDGLDATLEEALDDVVKVGGTGALVGLWLGSLSGQADPTLIRVPGGLPGRNSLCLSAVSQDGVYHAHARIETSVPTLAPMPLKPTPNWSYLGPLKQRYKIGQLASVIRRGANCDIDPRAPFVPTMVNPPDGHLTIMANYPRAFDVKAVVKAGQSRSGDPTPCDKAKIGIHTAGFNFTCTVDLSALPAGGGDSIITLSVSDVVGDSNQDFRIWLPAR